MWGFLVFLGILVVLTGCALMALGVAILTTFGNTLITTGAVAASGGFVITAMGLVLRQVERLTDRIEEGLSNIAQRPAAADAPAAIAPPAGRGRGAALAIEDLVAGEPPAGASAPALPQPEAERPASRPRPAPAAPPPAVDPMIEARRQRLEAEGAASSEPALPAPGLMDERPRERPVDPAPRGGERRAPPPPPMDLRPRPRTGYEPPPRARPAPDLPPPPALPRLDAPQPADDGGEPTILKSGIIAGMAYTLYSDGSIQAELPSGVVRFASLHELRDHVARTHRSGE